MQLGGVVGSSIQSKAGGMNQNGGEIHLVTGVGYGLLWSMCRECSVFLYFILYKDKGACCNLLEWWVP